MTVDDCVENIVTFPNAQNRRRQLPKEPEAPAFEMPKLKPVKAVPPPPPPPPPPPGSIPPPPPMSGLVKPSTMISEKKKEKLENIRKATRTRPDWRSVMCEVKVRNFIFNIISLIKHFL